MTSNLVVTCENWLLLKACTSQSRGKKCTTYKLLECENVANLTCNLQVRARLRRRIQAILPAMDVGTSTKRTSVMPSEVNEDSTAIAAPRKIKVHPLSDGEKTKRVSNKTSM